MKKIFTSPACRNKKITFFLFAGLILLLSQVTTAQVVILQQGFDSTSGSHSNGTWTNVSQIQNGGNIWVNSGTGNDVIEGNYSCSGWSTCSDKTGNYYGITGGAPTFKGTGTNIGYTTTNSTYFANFDDFDASEGTYGEIYSPVFNLSNYTNAHLTFYWNNGNSYESYIQVAYWNGSAWTGYTDFAEGTGTPGWHEATMSLPSTATELVFFVVSDWQYYGIGLDQIEIYATPNCTLSASINSSTNVSPCSTSTNGAASVTTTGGTSPFTYSWTPSSGLTGATTNSAGSMSKGVTYTCTVTDHNGCVATTTVTIGGPTVVSGTISSQTNVSCYEGNNGAVTVSGTGGSSPYTYSWPSGKGTNAAISSLSAGTYTCTVSDAHSCTGTIVVTITQPGLLRDSISSSSNALCNGGATGSATVGVKGGASPYTYSWSPSGGTHATASSLGAGTYTCTVTDHNGCTNTATVTITQPSAVTPTISSQNALCNGERGGASVTTTGGTSPYTYSWSTGSTSTSINAYAGSYTVTVTDNKGCTGTATVTITQPAEFNGYYTTYNICGTASTGGAISTVTTGGTMPYTYTWTPNVTTGDSAGNLSPGNYTVVIVDANGCSPYLEINTTIYNIPAETVSVTSTNVSCYGGSNGTATAIGNPTHAYVWEPSGSTNGTISGLSAGTYSVVATETDECTASTTVTITQPNVITPSIAYTNTCSGVSNGTASVSVTGGTSPYTYSWNTSPIQTNATATNLSSGNYTVTITDHNSCIATATVTISANPIPTLTITPSSASLCTGKWDSLKVSGASTYTWMPSTGLSVTTGAAVKADPGSTETYTVTGTNTSGCVNTKTVIVTVNPLPTLTISPSSATICSGSSDSLKASGGNTYTWSPSSGLSATSGSAVNANPTSTTTYTITGTNSNGCVNTQTVVITVNSLPTVSVTALHDTICTGTLDSLKASGAITYTWSPSTDLNATTGTKVAAINMNTTITYTVTGTNAGGCTSSASQTILVNSLPIVNADSDLVHYITGGALDATGGTAPYSYTWSPIPANPLLLPDTLTTYTLTVTDANGCHSSDTTIFIPVATPTVACGSLFISEYIQDSITGDNAIEIYNPTAGTVNLNNYYLIDATSDSGFAPPYLIQLHGTVAAYKTFLVVNKFATDTALTNKANMFSDSLNFDGREMVALAKFIPSSSLLHFTMLDKVGDLIIPSTVNGWPVGTGSTKSHVLIRQGNVNMGDLNWLTCQNKWNVFPKDTFTYLHKYANACTPGDPDLDVDVFAYNDCSAGLFKFYVFISATQRQKFNSIVLDFIHPKGEFYPDSVSHGITVTAGPNFQFISGSNDYTLNVTNLPGDTAFRVTVGDTTSTSPNGTIVYGADTLISVSMKLNGSQTSNPIDLKDFTYMPQFSSYTVTDSVRHIGPQTIYDTCKGCVCDSCKPIGSAYQCNCVPCYDAEGNFDSLCCSICYHFTDTCCHDTVTSHTVIDTTYTYTYHNYVYTNTNWYIDTPIPVPCPPTITDFTSPIDAGIDSILTITGTNFGITRGTGQVKFFNPDTSFYYASKMNTVDYLSWSENQIQILLPSWVDSVYSNKTKRSTVGGNYFVVKNSRGDTAVSGNNSTGNLFTVPFNISQDRNPSTNQKQEILLRRIDTNGGYIFHLNPTDFPVGSYKRAIFEKAVKEWVCYSGANLVIGRDTTINDTGQVIGINYVHFTNNPLLVNSTTVAVTRKYWKTCSAIQQSIFTEGDIYFNSNIFFLYDTSNTFFISSGQVDFYGICLHELGHFLQLEHSSDLTSLMYWTANTGPLSPFQRITLATADASAAVDGAIYSVQQSIKTQPYYCSGDSAMSPKFTACYNTVGINAIKGKSSNFVIYPNPSMGSFTVSTSELDYNVSIIDMLGQNIFNKKVTGGNTEIDISRQPNGMYFIELTDRHGTTTKKVIIQK